MRAPVIVGVVLIVLGILALAYQGISYTTEETVVDIGPLEAKAEERNTIPLPPILGVLALAGGVVLVIFGSRRA
jgi:Na+-transporting methylmalonyl-CoA/oxaloacetate decarboxylase gamma subunit